MGNRLGLCCEVTNSWLILRRLESKLDLDTENCLAKGKVGIIIIQNKKRRFSIEKVTTHSRDFSRELVARKKHGWIMDYGARCGNPIIDTR